jgi:hypothetical protein
MLRNKHIFFLAVLFSATWAIQACNKESAGAEAAAFSGGTGTAGSLSRFAIVGNYLYAVDMNQLNVFDITNPSATVKSGTHFIGFDIETIFPYQDKLFIGSATAMYIYSLANPVAPQQISAVQHFRACDPVVANDTVAYVTLRTGTRCGGVFNNLIVYDIKNIANPVEKMRINLTNPIGLGYRDSALYVCDKQQLRVYNINNTINPQPRTPLTATENFYDVIPYGNTLICYIDKGVSFYDITNRLQPLFLSKLTN